jgi:voltage-gated potassium channel
MRSLPIRQLPLDQQLAAKLRQGWALARRFKVVFFNGGLLFGVLPLVFTSLYRTPDGAMIKWGEALHHVYFLLFGQPSLPYVDNWIIEALNILIPPLGLATVVDGGVRFAYLFFAKHRLDKEWIEVITESMRDHIVVCGAGRVGYRVVEQLLKIGAQVVVVEKNEHAHFAGALRDGGVPVLFDDIANPKSLERVNVRTAQAIVCATNDDLANLNVALDARKLNPNLRIVLRLFDEDLVERVRDNFRAEAHSTSALSAPAIALSALDPRILHSFEVGSHLMVVSRFQVGAALEGTTVKTLRDSHGGLTLSLSRPQRPELMHPADEVVFGKGEVATVQLGWADYVKLRAHTGEAKAGLTGDRSLMG